MTTRVQSRIRAPTPITPLPPSLPTTGNAKPPTMSNTRLPERNETKYQCLPPPCPATPRPAKQTMASIVKWCGTLCVRRDIKTQFENSGQIQLPSSSSSWLQVADDFENMPLSLHRYGSHASHRAELLQYECTNRGPPHSGGVTLGGRGAGGVRLQCRDSGERKHKPEGPFPLLSDGDLS